jgi:hypothetical protein
MLGYVLAGILGFVLLVVLWRLRRYRAKFEHTGLLAPWPIPKVRLGDVDPLLGAGELGPKVDAQTHFLPDTNVQGGISNLETWVLTALAKRASLIVEFGTCTGKTTYLLARNSPRGCRVVTLTLGPEQVGAYADAPGDAARDRREALKESNHTRFFYTGTDVEPKVKQLFADSKLFDESEYVGACDLVFVDGSHAASYVASDSQKALRMVRPGGFVFWHDYRGPGAAPGVYRTLNDLAKKLPLRHVAGTSLVFYRAPVEGSAG